MAFRQLYNRLYAAFLALSVAAAFSSAAVLFATGRRPWHAGPTWGTRVAFHLSHTLSGIGDEPALRDAVQGAHDDLDVDVLVLDAHLSQRAAAGNPFVAPRAELLERGRKAAAWLPEPVGMVAAPMEDGGMVLLRFPAATVTSRRSRWGMMILAGLACTAILLYPLSRSITRPLEHLTQVARRFGEGDLQARSGIRRGDEVGQLARTFDEMAERIQAARRAERELLANVSHELRTPLARIQVAVELLNPRDQAQQERVKMIGGEVEELSRLIGDVLTTSKLELSAQPLQKRNVDLRDVAEKSRGRSLSLEPERPVEVDVPRGLSISADEGLLSRVLDNLVDNARKYDPSGKPIRIEGRGEPGTVLLAVEDRGPGIPQEDLQSIFEPFFRGGNARAGTTGFGLGLALARRVVEAHGGTIRALNAPSGGARLELRLPT